eukprot:364594-Chlamydomonas_euryale.AAC.11
MRGEAEMEDPVLPVPVRGFLGESTAGSRWPRRCCSRCGRGSHLAHTPRGGCGGRGHCSAASRVGNFFGGGVGEGDFPACGYIRRRGGRLA